MNFWYFNEDNSIPSYMLQVMNECVNGITLADPNIEDLPIMYANQAFLEMTGYSEEEMIGRNCRFLQGEETTQASREAIRKSIETCEPAEIEIVNYRKNGELFINKLKIIPLYNNQGEVIYFLGLQHDISRQRQLEKENNQLSSQLGLAAVNQALDRISTC